MILSTEDGRALAELEQRLEEGEDVAWELAEAWQRVNGWRRAEALYAGIVAAGGPRLTSAEARQRNMQGRSGAFVCVRCSSCGGLHAYHEEVMGYTQLWGADGDAFETHAPRGMAVREGRRFWVARGAYCLDDAMDEDVGRLLELEFVRVELDRVLEHQARSARLAVHVVDVVRLVDLAGMSPPDTGLLDELERGGHGHDPEESGRVRVRSGGAQGDLGAWAVELDGAVVLSGEWDFFQDVFRVPKELVTR